MSVSITAPTHLDLEWIQAFLADAKTLDDGVTLDVSDVQKVDFHAVQAVLMFAKNAADGGLGFSIAGADAEFTDIFQDMGVLDAIQPALLANSSDD